MDEPAASHQGPARTEPPEERASRQTGGQVMSRTSTSGAKGFAVILGAMLGIIGLLWLIAMLVSPH